jgi:hypothetical protein
LAVFAAAANVNGVDGVNGIDSTASMASSAAANANMGMLLKNVLIFQPTKMSSWYQMIVTNNLGPLPASYQAVYVGSIHESVSVILARENESQQ